MKIKPPPPWLMVTSAFYSIVIACKSDSLFMMLAWPAIAAVQFLTGLDGYLRKPASTEGEKL